MTIRQALTETLVNHGLWPEEAQRVLDAFEADDDNDPMRGRWHEQVTAYPPTLLAVLAVSAKDAAIAWLKANKPKHFALMILESQHTAPRT